jgi:hypothetical protein
MSSATSDPLLAGLKAAAARDPQAGSAALGRLLLDEASPILWRTIRSQLSGVPAADHEEIHSAALLRLTERLQQWLAGDPEVEIESFRAYVAATGANGCRAFLRARHPERTRLQNQLRYLLRHDADLALWEGSDGGLLCGLAAWKERAPAARSRPPQGVELALGAPAATLALPELVRRLFLWRGAPWTFRDLQTAVADLLGVQDRPALSLSGEGEESAGTDGADPQPQFDPQETRADAHRELEGRQFLTALWSEVRELPLGQRRALLLNLRDDQGRDRLALLTLTGLATRGELARMLDLAESELASFWEELPLDDRTLAARFDLTPRQVINLRKSARARLARRLRGRAAESEG